MQPAVPFTGAGWLVLGGIAVKKNNIPKRSSGAVRRLKSDKIFTAVDVLILFFIAVITLYPFLDTLLNSLSPTVDLMRNAKKIIRIPSYVDWSNYIYVLMGAQTLTSIKVTVSCTLIGTVLCLTITALTAYPLSKRDLPVGRFVIGAFLFTMVFQAGMIPTFLAIKQYKLIDTFWALLLPEMLSVYNMIIMRTFFSSLPYELMEAASIDGCSELGILVWIVLPLSTPVPASIGLFYAV